MPQTKMTGTNSVLLQRLTAALLAGKTGTFDELAEACFSTPQNVQNLLQILRKAGLARIISWNRRMGRGAQWKSVWGFGDGLPNEAMPKRGEYHGNCDINGSAMAIRVMEVMEQRGEVTLHMLAEEMRRSHTYMSSIVRTLHAAGLVHCKGWITGTGTTPTKIWAPGPGQDAPKPQAAARQEVSRRRKKNLTAVYGKDIANRILTTRKRGGPERIVKEGRTIWTRGAVRHRPYKQRDQHEL